MATSFARTGQRTGPGAGRTSKLYSRSDAEFAASLPARDHERAAMLLASALEHEPTGAARTGLMDGAYRLGLETAGESAAAITPERRDPLVDALERTGYEPVLDDESTIRLRNCPFHRLASQHRDLICPMNLSLIQGLIDALPQVGRTACLDRRETGCCVAVGYASASSNERSDSIVTR